MSLTVKNSVPKYEGQAVHYSLLTVDNFTEGTIAEIKLDLKEDSVNKFNALTLKNLREAIDMLKADLSAQKVKGLLITSGKDVFVVGADITEFLSHFKKTPEELKKWLLDVDKIFSDVEDLPIPSVVALNGFCLGGGCEFALSASYRVMSPTAKIGLPETKLGIFPGWGGTVRLSRLCGADNAIEWIASGDQYDAVTALKTGAVDAVIDGEKLRDGALDLLMNAMQGNLDWKARQAEKKAPLKLNPIEATMVFEGAKGFVAGKAGPNYPAPVAAIAAMQKGATLNRDEALTIEAEAFAQITKTPAAASLVGIFLADQHVKKVAKKAAKGARPVKLSAVLGAGIMGGGVAYQSASKKIPIIMKDITGKALELGYSEAIKLLEKQVARGKMTTLEMGETLSRIRATLSYGDFKEVDLVVEAVVENEKVKASVLAETEAQVKAETIIASNTSTISISRLAEALKRPENFCGMHFFNPVHKMPLVEVIRGKKSNEVAVATTVAYATQMGKTAIVVNDCPGFLVNRVLFPYFAGFMNLLRDGVEFQRIDKVMEKFGWPMGPAYLLDVVGIDTAHHADAVLADAFPDRMKASYKTAITAMYEAKRYGQKNGVGFYKYVADKKGIPKKEADSDVAALLQPLVAAQKTVTDEEIVERMMLPMIIECSRCLEEKIVDSPMEVDLGLIYGLGFPPFRGGAMKYSDSVGLDNLVKLSEKYQTLCKLYEPTAQMKNLAKSAKGFYSEFMGEK
jgi:3-hydroxyacyl-CoA dehydrogenase/enoyl-CoA hydratase/3-hydroxybutyryl-CoA epimerase/enoyl-CoA isomerase